MFHGNFQKTVPAQQKLLDLFCVNFFLQKRLPTKTNFMPQKIAPPHLSPLKKLMLRPFCKEQLS